MQAGATSGASVLAVGVDINVAWTGTIEALIQSNEMEATIVSNEIQFAAQVIDNEASDFILDLVLLDVTGQPILDVMGNYILGS